MDPRSVWWIQGQSGGTRVSLVDPGSVCWIQGQSGGSRVSLLDPGSGFATTQPQSLPRFLCKNVKPIETGYDFFRCLQVFGKQLEPMIPSSCLSLTDLRKYATSTHETLCGFAHARLTSSAGSRIGRVDPVQTGQQIWQERTNFSTGRDLTQLPTTMKVQQNCPVQENHSCWCWVHVNRPAGHACFTLDATQA